MLSERPGAVKGAPLLGAAQRTLDGEDRSEMIAEEGKAGRKVGETWAAKMVPSPTASNTSLPPVILPLLQHDGMRVPSTLKGTGGAARDAELIPTIPM